MANVIDTQNEQDEDLQKARDAYALAEFRGDIRRKLMSSVDKINISDWIDPEIAKEAIKGLSPQEQTKLKAVANQLLSILDTDGK